MAENSNIEWTHHTFNPWIGCQKVGPGCDHCYAETWDARGLQQRESRWGAHAARTRTSTANWNKPRAWDKKARAEIAVGLPRPRVFCASLADVFDNHASVDPVWRGALWRLIAETPHLDWMLLTKRPGNIAGMLPDGLVAPAWEDGYPNVWLGCTITSRDEMLRDAPKLKSVDARVRFWSVEPLLGDIGEIPCDLLPDLVIVGGESGPGARPMHPDWARSLRDQCVAAGVAFHFKQWGEWAPGENAADVISGHRANATWWDDDWLFGETNMADPEADWDDEPDLYRIGKKAAGRLLDGRTWDQMPEVRHG